MLIPAKSIILTYDECKDGKYTTRKNYMRPQERLETLSVTSTTRTLILIACLFIDTYA